MRAEQGDARLLIHHACVRAGLDAATSGWIAPPPAAEPVPFTPTPELVHGIVVGNSHLAGFLRKAGWWSGKPRREVPADA